jgi:hypothetical protein
MRKEIFHFDIKYLVRVNVLTFVLFVAARVWAGVLKSCLLEFWLHWRPGRRRSSASWPALGEVFPPLLPNNSEYVYYFL